LSSDSSTFASFICFYSGEACFAGAGLGSGLPESDLVVDFGFGFEADLSD